MKQAATGTISGCLVWIISFGVIGMCILPVSMAVGGLTSVSDFAVKQTGAIVCPNNTTPKIRSFATYGSGPSTTSVLQCVDASGNVVKEDPVGFAFLWIGIIAVIGLVISALLAFALAAPAGVLIGRFINRMKTA
jgi:hypothetical protein